MNMIEAGNHWRWLPFRQMSALPELPSVKLFRNSNATSFKFLAAFSSLWCSVPHLGQIQLRSSIVKSLLTYPHMLHVYNEANHLLASTIHLPCSSALAFSLLTKQPHPKSCTDFPWLFLSFKFFRSSQVLNFAMSFKDKVSMAITSFSSISKLPC